MDGILRRAFVRPVLDAVLHPLRQHAWHGQFETHGRSSAKQIEPRMDCTLFSPYSDHYWLRAMWQGTAGYFMQHSNVVTGMAHIPPPCGAAFTKLHGLITDIF